MEARLKLNLPVEIPLILFFGIVRPYKGLQILLESISKLRSQAVNTFLVIAGEFWDKKETYLHIIKSLQLSDQVRIEDRYLPNDEVDLYFSAADLLVAPYIGGTQSGAVALAIGYGVPIVLTKQIALGISEDYNSQVKVVDKGNPEELTTAIREILERPIVHQPVQPAINSSWKSLVNLLEEMPGVV
jgi:glycosyltransferase involved in cell wall biosynthesis